MSELNNKIEMSFYKEFEQMKVQVTFGTFPTNYIIKEKLRRIRTKGWLKSACNYQNIDDLCSIIKGLNNLISNIVLIPDMIDSYYSYINNIKIEDIDYKTLSDKFLYMMYNVCQTVESFVLLIDIGYDKVSVPEKLINKEDIINKYNNDPKKGNYLFWNGISSAKIELGHISEFNRTETSEKYDGYSFHILIYLLDFMYDYLVPISNFLKNRINKRITKKNKRLINIQKKCYDEVLESSDKIKRTKELILAMKEKIEYKKNQSYDDKFLLYLKYLCRNRVCNKEEYEPVEDIVFFQDSNIRLCKDDETSDDDYY